MKKILVVLALILLVTFILIRFKKSSSTDNGPQPVIILHTVPGNSDVTVDGKFLGKSPVVIKYKKDKKISLQVRHEGYFDYESEIDGSTFRNVDAIVLKAKKRVSNSL